MDHVRRSSALAASTQGRDDQSPNADRLPPCGTEVTASAARSAHAEGTRARTGFRPLTTVAGVVLEVINVLCISFAGHCRDGAHGAEVHGPTGGELRSWPIRGGTEIFGWLRLGQFATRVAMGARFPIRALRVGAVAKGGNMRHPDRHALRAMRRAVVKAFLHGFAHGVMPLARGAVRRCAGGDAGGRR